jgi:predicted  nucleic acid-binding Zn-ribbon protein
MNPNLSRLVRLQQIENAAEDARRVLADHPVRIAALESRLDVSRGAVAASRERLTANQAARREIEKELAVVQGRLSKFKDQLMEVKTNREYQAMQKEIEVARTEVASMEDRILERLLESDEISGAVKQAERELAGEERAVAAERAAFEQDRARLEQDLTKFAADRKALVAEIDSDALAVFEHVARGRKGVAVAEARDGHCTICHVRLRPQVFNEVRRNDSIIRCESCQRILYFAEIAAANTAPSPPASE